jgi:hypothetical protein
MQRIMTIVLAVVVAGTLSVSQARAESKGSTTVKLDKVTAKTDFSAVRYGGGYCGSHSSSCYSSYCSPCYSSYCSPCYSSYCSPCYSSYYSSSYYGSHRMHHRR